MKPRVANIRDVARVAEVSRTTVSLVMNNSPVPSVKTRTKILNAVKELNYRPDPAFRQALLRRRAGHEPVRQATQTIGFLTSEGIFESVQAQDGYYSRVVAGIHRVLDRRRYHLMWKTERSDAVALPAMVAEGRVDGLLIEGTFPAVLRELLARHLPVTFIDRTYPELSANSVMPNVERAVKELLQYLWELGHRNVVTFQQLAPSVQVDAYVRGFRDFFAEKGEPIRHPDACRRRDVNPETHWRVMAEYASELVAVRPRPTALLSWDQYAAPLMGEIQKLGLRVPDDISIVGMDDILMGRLATPQLTTYRFPMDELGRSGTEMVIEQIEDRTRAVRHLLINGQMVERASCAKPSATI